MAMTRSKLKMAKATPTSALSSSPTSRRATLIDAGDGAEKQAVAAHGIDYPCAHQVQGIQGTEERDHHDGAEDEISVRPEDALGGQAQGEVIAGYFIHWQDIKHSRVDQQINHDDGEKAGEDGTRNEMPGFLISSPK